MAIPDGVLGLVSLTPEFVDAVTELAVPDDRAVVRWSASGLRQQSRSSQGGQATGEEGTTGERRHWKKMTDGR
jgi:hypothetical protein